MSTTVSPQIEEGWKKALAEEFKKDYFLRLKQFLLREKESGAVVYPPGKLIFHAFDSTPFDQVKVVILGQDPYHGPGQAHGLCFSVPMGVKPPPSLVNIFKELRTDVGITMPTHGNLEAWAKQGVLLLNALLTVRDGTPGAHKDQGWETFTDAAIRAVNDHHQGVVFILWGAYAQKKGSFIDRKKHLVLTSAHPSPLSATKFMGCKHFSQTNAYLKSVGKEPIVWQI
jgi:uracil-DNA glycosylase